MAQGPVSHQTFWESGDLRCILVRTDLPRPLAVQVVRGGLPICAELCSTVEEGATIADRLRRIFATGDS